MVIAGDRVDEAATAERRAARQVEALRTASAGAQSAGDPVRFDFGPARREHERPWPPELQDAFIELLMSLPAPYRAYVHRTLHARAETLSDQRPLTPGDLQRLWLELRGSVGFR